MRLGLLSLFVHVPTFDDYPKMGVWPDAYYETFNMFQNGQTYVGPDACAYDRNECWLANPPRRFASRRLLRLNALLAC